MIVSRPRNGYRGRLPHASARDLRGLLARSLAGLGLSQPGGGQFLTIPRSTAPGTPKPGDPEVDPATAPELPDVPPAIDPPLPYRRPEMVAVSAKFIASLKREYAAEGDGRTRRIGRQEDVAAWIAGLKPGQVRPRPTQ